MCGLLGVRRMAVRPQTLGFATEIHPETSNELFLSYPRVSDARGLCKFFLRNRNTGVNLKPWVLNLSKREQWWHCWSRIFGNVIPLRNFTRWVGLAVSLRVVAGCHTEFPQSQKSEGAVSVAGFSFLHTTYSHLPVTLSPALWTLKALAFSGQCPLK